MGASIEHSMKAEMGRDRKAILGVELARTGGGTKEAFHGRRLWQLDDILAEKSVSLRQPFSTPTRRKRTRERVVRHKQGIRP
jgi:hypothetical protein